MNETQPKDTGDAIRLTAFKLDEKPIEAARQGKKISAQIKEALVKMNKAKIDGFFLAFEPGNLAQYKKLHMMLSRYGRALGVKYQYAAAMEVGEIKILPK